MYCKIMSREEEEEEEEEEEKIKVVQFLERC